MSTIPTAAPPSDTAAAYPAVAAPVPAESRGLSVASLVIGLLSIVAGFTFLLPLAGLVLGVLAISREPGTRTMAIWGVVLNGVMLAGAVVAGISAVVFGLALLPFTFI